MLLALVGARTCLPSTSPCGQVHSSICPLLSDGLCNAATRTALTGSVHGWTHLLHGQSRRTATGVFRQGQLWQSVKLHDIFMLVSTAMVGGGTVASSG